MMADMVQELIWKEDVVDVCISGGDGGMEGNVWALDVVCIWN